MLYSRTIVDVETLKQHIDDSLWVVVDCRFDPKNHEKGHAAFLEGHIKGAFFADVINDMSGLATETSGRHPLPRFDFFVATLQKYGVNSKTQIVAYDDSSSIYSARFWWMCQWAGHQNVAVLNGGWKQWQKQAGLISCDRLIGLPLDASDMEYLSVNHSMWVDVDYVERIYRSSRFRLIDARLNKRFTGEEAHLEKYHGHIPGAVNHQYTDNLDNNGLFLDPGILQEKFLMAIGDVPIEHVIHQCGAGITACNNLLAMELAELSGSRFYPGSWSEWCSSGERPMRLKSEI